MTPDAPWPRDWRGRAKILPTRPVLGSFVVMLVGVNLAFMTYGQSGVHGHHSLVGRGDFGGLPVALAERESL